MARLGDLELDVAETEQPTMRNNVTDRPVENEADISDYIKSEPMTFRISAIFSGDEALDKYEQLITMRNDEEVYTYSGAFGNLENMSIEEISALKDASYGDGYECTISLKQIRIATLEETEIELGIDPETGENVQEDTDDGEAENKEAEEDEVDEETLPPTSLRIFTNHGLDFLSDDEDEEGEEE